MNHLSGIGIEKYGLRAFQRRIGRIHTISGHDFRRLYTSIQNRLKSAELLTNLSPVYILAQYMMLKIVQIYIITRDRELIKANSITIIICE